MPTQKIKPGKEPWFELLPGTDAEEVVRHVRKHLRRIANVRGVIVEQTIQVTTVVNARGNSWKSSAAIGDAEVGIMNEFSLRPLAIDFVVARETREIWVRHRNGRHAVIKFTRRPTRRRKTRAK